MDLGWGFLAGLMAGGGLAAVIGVITASYRQPLTSSGVIAQPGRRVAYANDVRRRPSTRTVFVEKEEGGDGLQNNIQQVRDLLRTLSTIITCTDDASDQAAAAFNTVRKTLDTLPLDDLDLARAQQTLVKQLDAVLKTNATLHRELEQANRGIVEQRRQIEHLRKQARMDSLTRIANRTFFNERLDELIAECCEPSATFTLLLMDIDFFKSINDRFGHLDGDRVLRGVARKIAGGVRRQDFLARYGGEEFAVLLPRTDPAEAGQVADRVRHDVEKTKFRLDEKVVRITLSGGLAQYKMGMNSQELLLAADQALYQAKHEGRNRIAAAP